LSFYMPPQKYYGFSEVDSAFSLIWKDTSKESQDLMTH
jgi:hypothetical protein